MPIPLSIHLWRDNARIPQGVRAFARLWHGTGAITSIPIPPGQPTAPRMLLGLGIMAILTGIPAAPVLAQSPGYFTGQPRISAPIPSPTIRNHRTADITVDANDTGDGTDGDNGIDDSIPADVTENMRPSAEPGVWVAPEIPVVETPDTPLPSPLSGSDRVSSAPSGIPMAATPLETGIDAIPTNLPSHASGASVLHQPRDLLAPPPETPDASDLETVIVPPASLAEQYRQKKRGIAPDNRPRSRTGATAGTHTNRQGDQTAKPAIIPHRAHATTNLAGQPANIAPPLAQQPSRPSAPSASVIAITQTAPEPATGGQAQMPENIIPASAIATAPAIPQPARAAEIPATDISHKDIANGIPPMTAQGRTDGGISQTGWHPASETPPDNGATLPMPHAQQQAQAQPQATDHAVASATSAGTGTEQPLPRSADGTPSQMPAPIETGTNIPAGDYAVQLGAFRDQTEIFSYWASFALRYPDLAGGHPRQISPTDLGDRGIYHRLRLAGFASLSQAQEKCRQLLADGTDCFATSNP